MWDGEVVLWRHDRTSEASLDEVSPTMLGRAERDIVAIIQERII